MAIHYSSFWTLIATTAQHIQKKTFVYNGKAHTPKVRVTTKSGKTLKKGTNYTVTNSKHSRNIGKHYVTLKFKGSYKAVGTIKLAYTVNPAKAALKSVKAGKKKITCKAKKQAGGVKYQFSYKKGKTTKYVTSKSTKKVIKKLSSKKTYTVKVRAIKKVGSKTYKGSWSAAKKVKVK
jgi:hypothetical protein